MSSLGGSPAIGVVPDTAIKSTWAMALAANAVSVAKTLDTRVDVFFQANLAKSTTTRSMSSLGGSPAIGVMLDTAIKSTWAVELAANVLLRQRPMILFWLWIHP